ncbi:sensor histidine kinase [Flavobacterium sp.]|uniref:sensor histidine kinase n=1 Tax=Flavobacterium sp. TaxID=239 RepID=UPI003D0C5CB8
MKLITHWKYHVLNFFGWQVYVLFTLAFEKLSYKLSNTEKWTALENNSLRYFLVEGVLCGFLGFFLSNIILLYVDYRINLKKFNTKTFYGLTISFAITQFLYHIFLWPMLNVPASYYLDREVKLNGVMKLANVPFFTIAFLVWLFVVMTYKVIKYLKEIRIKQLELESDLKESTLNALKGQINPHFMFNSLNNIRGLILEDPSRSRDMLTRLSEMLRYSLTKNDLHEIKLEDELEMVENYIQISKIQLEERLQYVSDIAPETMSLKIPPMVLQMLVENAVKHGVANLKEGGIVRVHTKVENERLLLQVINTGKLRIQTDSTHIGLKNIASRLKLLYGDKAYFDLTEANNEVTACITIPLV